MSSCSGCMCCSRMSCKLRLSCPSSQWTCRFHTATVRSSCPSHPLCKALGAEQFVNQQLQTLAASLLSASVADSESIVGIYRMPTRQHHSFEFIFHVTVPPEQQMLRTCRTSESSPRGGSPTPPPHPCTPCTLCRIRAIFSPDNFLEKG